MYAKNYRTKNALPRVSNVFAKVTVVYFSFEIIISLSIYIGSLGSGRMREYYLVGNRKRI